MGNLIALVLVLLMCIPPYPANAAFPTHKAKDGIIYSAADSNKTKTTEVARHGETINQFPPHHAVSARGKRTLHFLSILFGILFVASIAAAILTGMIGFLIGWPVFGIAGLICALAANDNNRIDKHKMSAGMVMGIVALSPVILCFVLPRLIGAGVVGFINLFKAKGKKIVIRS